MTALDPDAAAPRRPSRPIVAASVVTGLAATALLLAQGWWLPALLMAVATLAAALVPALRLPGALVATLAVASVVNGASIAWNWYEAWDPFDRWAHFLNHVVLVAPSMIWFERARLVPARADGAGFVAWAAAYGLALALAWEAIELLFWTFPLADTLSDVALGVLGSAFAGWWAGRIVAASRGGASA